MDIVKYSANWWRLWECCLVLLFFIVFKHLLCRFFTHFKATLNWIPNTHTHFRADSYIPLCYNIWSKRNCLRMRMSVVCACSNCVCVWHEKTDNNIKEIRELKLMTIIFLAFCLKKRSACEWRRQSFLQLLLLCFFVEAHQNTHTLFMHIVKCTCTENQMGNFTSSKKQAFFMHV